eukprot:9032667-Pyramimonas_sp.AAC.1
MSGAFQGYPCVLAPSVPPQRLPLASLARSTLTWPSKALASLPHVLTPEVDQIHGRLQRREPRRGNQLWRELILC